MLTAKGKIRVSLFAVAFIALGTSLLSLSYMTRMFRKIDAIINKDVKIADLGEAITIKILEARREEKNFIIYLDSLHIGNNRRILDEIQADVEAARGLGSEYAAEMDSITFYLGQYKKDMALLVTTIREDPRSLYRLQQQIINYEQELRALAEKRKIDVSDLPGWTSDVNASLVSAATKLSTEKSRLFSELRDMSNHIIRLAGDITQRARASLAESSAQGIRYSLKAQRNTMTLLIMAAILLAYLVVDLPRRVFMPYRKIMRFLQAVARGEPDWVLPDIQTKDEMGELSVSFRTAIEKLQYYNDLKASKIAELHRSFYRLMDEVSGAVLLLSPDLKILYMNDATAKLFDIDRERIGTTVKDLTPLWAVLNGNIVNIERKGKFELSLKLKKRYLICWLLQT